MNRQLAWQTYEKLPPPQHRNVMWQRFDLRSLKLQDVEKRPQSVRVTLNAAPGVTLAPLAEHHPELGRSIPADEPNRFAALNAALWQHGALLHVPAHHHADRPLEITYEVTGENVTAFPRTLVVIEPGAEATLIQRFTGNATGLHAGVTEVFVKEGGRLHYISEQNFGDSLLDFTLKRAHVARDAEIDWVVGMFGGSLTHYDVECVMDGEGGTSFMYGIGAADGKQQIGQFTRQHHRTGNTTSDLMFKNVLRDAARTHYVGTIKVEKNANGTNAYQANRNLVLSEKVKCDTRPILEIESNRLRCTHGATVGRLDENQLYYLRSRGLTAAQAQNMLIEAFLEPILARIRIPAVYDEFQQLVRQKALR